MIEKPHIVIYDFIIRQIKKRYVEKISDNVALEKEKRE